MGEEDGFLLRPWLTQCGNGGCGSSVESPVSQCPEDIPPQTGESFMHGRGYVRRPTSLKPSHDGGEFLSVVHRKVYLDDWRETKIH